MRLFEPEDVMSPQEIADQCAALMWADDHAARGLGVAVVAVGPGSATVRMTVRQDMVNVHGTCHGGFIFSLAHTAMAYACHVDNQRKVAGSSGIDYLAPVYLNDVLTATGRQRHQGSRAGLYDIEVVNQDDRLVAVYRGRTVRIKGHFFDPA